MMWILATLLLATLPATPAGAADEITTPAIVEATLEAAEQCVHWRLKGTCVFLKCTGQICTPRFSPRVEHYSPDVVVSAYHQVGDNPWSEISQILGGPQQQVADILIGAVSDLDHAGAGSRGGATTSDTRHHLKYREADAIGHPVAGLGMIAGMVPVIGDFLCPPHAIPFVPYYQSTLDVIGWRFGVPDMLMPQALVPGLHELGQWPLWSWGGVYPRSGFVAHPEDPKAAALVAQRVGNIITQTGQPHVYVPITERATTMGEGGFSRGDASGSGGGSFSPGNWAADTGSALGEIAVQSNQLGAAALGMMGAVQGAYDQVIGATNLMAALGSLNSQGISALGASGVLGGRGSYKYFPAGELLPRKPETGTWQMLVPNVESSCQVFAAEQDVVALRSWSAGKHSTPRRYAWALWRPYDCCRRRGEYVQTIDF